MAPSFLWCGVERADPVLKVAVAEDRRVSTDADISTMSYGLENGEKIVNISARLTAVCGLKYEEFARIYGFVRSTMYEITRTRRWPRRRRATLCTYVQHGS